MFDKDKEIGNRVDTEFDLKEDFIIWSAEVAPGFVSTKLGEARKTIMDVSRMDDPDIRFEVTTLASAIADKAEQVGEDDFPCVVQLRKVAGRYSKGEETALVLQYVRPWKV
jgi:hypothetical protein